ncbi:MAG: serine protease, partial [Candidatus Zixiibacteriota bacterium]
MRFRYSLALVCFLLLIAGHSAMAQISYGGKPVSLERKIQANIQKVMMPAVDVPALLAEDEIEEAEGMPFRFGKPIEVDYDLANSGTWEEFPDGSALWRLEIASPGAYSLNLVYDRYWLPPGAKFFIYNSDRSTTIGAFTEQNNKEYGKFATAPVPGDICILEYYEPDDVRGKGDIAVSHVVHAYKNIFNYNTTKELLAFGSSGACNNNVNCPEGEPWQSEK